MNDENLISKSRRKRQARELQDIGVTLTRLRADQLSRIEMPDDLREAVVECRKMTKHEAIRRQLQLIGRIMRNLDAAPIAAQLEALHAPSLHQTALFHRVEKWRDDLLADPGAVERFALEYPGADPQRLRSLAAAALEERLAERPPKRYRELFRAINAVLEEHAKRTP
ncbi:MAG TPA: ribosome biogenesis factor YjgA [Usitatibacteraceae bacterium]|nr:ribosome biogenesis factor YjgA [Usitatibacteraceae bacterium]